MAAADFGRDAGEADRQILDQDAAELALEPGAQTLAADEPAAGEGKINEAEHPPPGQRAGESLEHVELAGRVAASDQRADRRADDHVGPDAQRVELLQRADMRPAARRARAEHEADPRRTAAHPARPGLQNRFSSTEPRTSRCLLTESRRRSPSTLKTARESSPDA